MINYLIFQRLICYIVVLFDEMVDCMYLASICNILVMSIGCDIIKIWIALVNNCCLIQIRPDPTSCVCHFPLIPVFRY
jgi:hypothetical protein